MSEQSGRCRTLGTITGSMKGGCQGKTLPEPAAICILGSQPRYRFTWSIPRQVPATSRSRLRLRSPVSLPRLNPAAEAVGTVGKSPRFCFLRRVFQAMWKPWKNCLCSLIFPRLPQSGSFHSFPARSPNLPLVSDPLPSITIATTSFVILSPSSSSRVGPLPTTVLFEPRGLQLYIWLVRGGMQSGLVLEAGALRAQPVI